MGAQEILLGMAGKKTRTAMRAAYPTLRDGPKVEEVRHLIEDPLHDVEFASPDARALAEENGLTWSDFAASMQAATGKSGYRTSDVRAVIAERDEE